MEKAQTAMEQLQHAESDGAALSLIRTVDSFINRTEPFNLAKDESQKDQLGAILYQCLEAVRIASLLLWATIPAKMAELGQALGLSVDPSAGQLADLAEWGGLQPGSRIQKVALFPRVDSPVPAKA